MNIIIINCFPSLENNRVIPILEYHEKRKDNVKLLTSNFHHYNKEKITLKTSNTIQFNVLKYKKNISITRILSHLFFSLKVYKYLKKNNPDIVYVKIPPNSLLYYLKKIKKKRNIYIIGDIYDLWPESMPTLHSKNIIFKTVFELWKRIRKTNIDCIDYTIYECDLYKKYVSNNGNYNTLYLCREDYLDFKIKNSSDIDSIIRLCYLGNVGQLLDIELLEQVIDQLVKYKKIEFHIIGDGNSKLKLVTMLKKKDVVIKDHGLVFEEEKKKQIMLNCDFGLNFMKPNLIIGLSNKSIDYFKCGLPILNTVNGDTEYLINQYHAGYTVNMSSINELNEWIINLDNEKLIKLKENSRMLYTENFTKEIFIKNYEEIYKFCLKQIETK